MRIDFSALHSRIICLAVSSFFSICFFNRYQDTYFGVILSLNVNLKRITNELYPESRKYGCIYGNGTCQIWKYGIFGNTSQTKIGHFAHLSFNYTNLRFPPKTKIFLFFPPM